MRRTPSRCALPSLRLAALWLCTASVALGWSAPSHGASLHYDLTPFSARAPEIARAYALLHGEGTTEAQRAEGIAALAPWLQPSPSATKVDPHLHATARWLSAALRAQASTGELTVQKIQEARAADRAGAGDSLLGATAIFEAHLEIKSGRAKEGALSLLSVPSSVSGHEEAWRRGVEALLESGDVSEAIAALEAHLALPLHDRVERRVSDRVIELLQSSGEKARATQLLRDRWWSAREGERREALRRRLKEAGAPVPSAWQFTRPLLEVRSSRADGELKRLAKLRKRKGADKALVDWGRALLGRLKSKTREESVPMMERLKGSMRGDVRRPLWHLGSALVLRKVNRDLEAAVHYAALVSGWPEHPYANRARVEAAWLLSRRGLPSEAAALWAAAADSPGRSEAQRDGLWWGGFAAVLRGDTERAVLDLTRLRQRYGDERDGVAITWDERASYWLGRAYQESAQVPLASREYASVASRYPMSWYGLQAADRLDELSPLFPSMYRDLEVSEEEPLRRALKPVDAIPGVESLRVARDPTLSLAVAYLRLGRLEEARGALEALLASDRLTGGGRKLLANLYGHAGKEQSRQRVLRYGTVLVEAITPELQKMYRHRHPLTHEEILVTECLSRGVSASLFAGLVYVESRFKPTARSGVGAVGLAQIMPSTARLTSKSLLGYKVSKRQLRRPETNLALGTALLGALLEHFRGHAPAALAAYNAGRGATRGWLRDRGHLPTDAFVESIPYSQTRRYAMRVVSIAHVYMKLYGFEGEAPKIPPRLPLALEAFDADSPGP